MQPILWNLLELKSNESILYLERRVAAKWCGLNVFVGYVPWWQSQLTIQQLEKEYKSNLDPFRLVHSKDSWIRYTLQIMDTLQIHNKQHTTAMWSKCTEWEWGRWKKASTTTAPRPHLVRSVCELCWIIKSNNCFHTESETTLLCVLCGAAHLYKLFWSAIAVFLKFFRRGSSSIEKYI